MPLSSATAVTWLTSSFSVSSSGARASSQACTAEQIALAAPGSATTLPNVASAPSSVATVRAASTVAAYGIIGSRRSASFVVPAWSARPVKSIRHRPCGQIDPATPTGAFIPSSALPCSMCSSTKAAIRETILGVRPDRVGVQASLGHRVGQA